MRKLLALLGCMLAAALSPPVLAQAAEPVSKLIEKGRAEGSVSIPSFKRLLTERPGAFHLIDASSAREFAAGSIKGAINIPINQLEKQLASLPSDKPIIFFCATGGRASEAYDTVKSLRPELVVHFLDAQVQILPDGSPNIR